MTKKPRPPVVAGDDHDEETLPPWAEGLRRMWSASLLPGVGALSLLKLQHKNVHAVTEANRIAMEASLAVAECQHKILRESWEQLLTSTQHFVAGEFGADAAAHQAERVRLASERFLEDMGELAGLVAKTNTDLALAVGERLMEMVDEIGQLALQRRN